MSEQGPKGPYRAFWELTPVLRSFLEAVRDHAPVEVRASLRDAVDPQQVLAVPEDAFRDAIDAWLSPGYGCEALASLFKACRGVHEGRAGEAADAAERDLGVSSCVARHGGEHCSARLFLVALVNDCRRECRDYCLGVQAGDGEADGCQGYAQLYDAVRRCLAANGTRCHAADDLDELAPAEEEAPGDDPSLAAAISHSTESLLSPVWAWTRRGSLVADRDVLRRAVAAFGGDPLLPEVVYHKFFLLVVYGTLREWAASPARRERLDWVFPAVARVDLDDGLRELHQGLTDYAEPGAGDGSPPLFVCWQSDPCRYEITFRPAKWDFLAETPARAAERMGLELGECVKRMLARHYEELKQAEDLGPARPGLDPDHARWLVQWQVVGEKIFTQIASSDPENKGTYKEVRHGGYVVGRAVQDAARLLIGPRFDTWLRRPRVGRPPKLQQG